MAPSTRGNPDGTSGQTDPITAQLAAIVARLESFESLREDVAALKYQSQSRNKNKWGPGYYEDGDSSFRSNQYRPHTKIVFPTFSNGDPRGWILKEEKYFRYYQIPDDEKVDVASMHLEGDALDLYSWLSTDQPVAFWEELTHALQKHFGPAEFQNPDEYLCNIKQIGTVQEYRQ